MRDLARAAFHAPMEWSREIGIRGPPKSAAHCCYFQLALVADSAPEFLLQLFSHRHSLPFQNALNDKNRDVIYDWQECKVKTALVAEMRATRASSLSKVPFEGEMPEVQVECCVIDVLWP